MRKKLRRFAGRSTMKSRYVCVQPSCVRAYLEDQAAPVLIIIARSGTSVSMGVGM